MNPDRDVVIVGGGHNGLVAAAYLARAGRSVLVLERGAQVGGAAVSGRPFAGVDVRLSRYAYLVSLLPTKIVRDLDLRVTLRRRRVSSYTPVGDTGLLITDDPARTAASLAGFGTDLVAWQRFYAMCARVAERIAPTLTEPLRTAAELRALLDDDAAWRALFEQPLSVAIEEHFADDTVRGVALTDALIGTFAAAEETSLRQNRCFLYHVIGNGTGDWTVPVGGMGAVTAALADAAAGAEIVTGAEVLAVSPDGDVRYRHGEEERTVHGGHVLANVAPRTLSRLLGEDTGDDVAGAQLKVNMVLRRLPRLRDSTVDPADAFAGTFHVNEGYAHLAFTHHQASRGYLPSVPPCEIYCHSLTDPSILGPAERAAGLHTLTLFGLHQPAGLFAADPAGTRAAAVRATFASLNSVLTEPVEDCLATDADGAPCVEAKSPVDLEHELGLPSGHIFHSDLSWPYAETADAAGTWGVATGHERILLCGSGAARGGGVSGIPGHNAAMAVLHAR